MADLRPARPHVLIVDGDETFRAFARDALERDGFCTAEAESGEKALATAFESPPRLVLLDVHLPGISGYEVCRVLREKLGEQLPIVFVSGERTESYDRVAGLLIGADDYLAKPVHADELLARVRTLFRRMAQLQSAAGLTPRELEVLILLAGGRSSMEIAHELVISPKTVGTHIEHILAKLGVHSRAEAIGVAYREQLIASSGVNGVTRAG